VFYEIFKNFIIEVKLDILGDIMVTSTSIGR